MLKVPGSKLLRLRYDGPLSNFAFNCNSRRYIQAGALLAEAADRALASEGEGFDEYYYTSRKEQPMHNNGGGGGGGGPNAFASLERMLEARISAASAVTPGRAVQPATMKPVLRAPGYILLKLRYDVELYRLQSLL